MRNSVTSVVATIAASVTLACSDAAVDQVTAPPLAATPAKPVLNEYPGTWEYTEAGIPAAIGIRITTSPRWSNDYLNFIVVASVSFEWANYVSASLNTSVVDTAGRTLNTGSAGVLYSRFLLPVAEGDTTFTVSISTLGKSCGLTGRHSYSGTARQMAVNLSFAQMSLWHQDIQQTTGMDSHQPGCVPPPPPGCEEEPVSRVVSGAITLASSEEECEAPTPPNGGGVTTDPIEVCYIIWREYWIYDLSTYTLKMLFRVPVGVQCYTVNMS